jgi:two-component system, cell cycle sensor histidine kinase and response regulator CckA
MEAGGPHRERLEWWIPGIYLATAGAWIYGSDALVAAVAGSVEQQRVISTYKGFGFVVVTGTLLHLGLRWALRRQRAATDRLRDSEALLRAVTDTLPDPVFLKGLDGRMIFCNPATLEILGKPARQVIGRTSLEIYDDPGLGAGLMETDRRIMASGVAEVVEEQIPTPRGMRTFLASRAPSRDADGRVVGLICTAKDITDRKQAERELLASEQRLQQAQRLESVGRLAGGVAHDFNNLLTVILGGSETLREDLAAGRPASPDEVEQIHAAGERARDLTRQLLAFARRQVTTLVPLDLNAVVRGSERLLRRVLGEDVEIRTALAPGLWPVRGDAGQLEQVIVNLALNARDAMPHGGTLTLETRNAGPPTAGPAPGAGWVQLLVRDTGVGMSPLVKAHLFEPFFTTKPPGRGTGLGLATVHGIVAQAGGRVRVESEPGRGTAFEISLPRGLQAVTAVAEPSAGPAPMVGGTESVLVVEDDPLVREVTARALRSGGYRVLLADGGADALQVVAREGAALRLVVTDVVMPGLDGKTLADELVRRLPGVRVLFVSGYTRDVISHHGVLDSGIEFLPKPFTSSALLARVRGLLDRP